jgi:hypothetical protein
VEHQRPEMRGSLVRTEVVVVCQAGLILNQQLRPGQIWCCEICNALETAGSSKVFRRQGPKIRLMGIPQVRAGRSAPILPVPGRVVADYQYGSPAVSPSCKRFGLVRLCLRHRQADENLARSMHNDGAAELWHGQKSRSSP